ncbi:MAG: transglycosylase domain-containing protein [Ruminococcus sp.]|jgi:penicillin-binding protein 1A|nr:transglycosylase domain-containing protein [Ruminococcus sp.]
MAVNRKRKRKHHPVKKVLAFVGTSLLSLLLIIIITVAIIAAALTVYVMQYINDAELIDINNVPMDYSTFIYATDKNGNEIELKKISRNADRIPIDISEVPQQVKDAFVYIEDERFYEHDGVDWKRTFGAFLNEFLSMWGSRQGGSTITQQLVKNVTGDEIQNFERKLREIFRASKLEEYYTKSDILEAYLNIVGMGGSTSGIQAASLKYFNKNCWEIDLAEAACLAAIPKDPNENNPFYTVEDPETGEIIERGIENNRKRQLLVLDAMLSNNAISEAEYERAVNKKLVFADRSRTSESGDDGIQSWFVDDVIRDVTLDLADLYGITFEEANDRLYNGGYMIYTTVDLEMQEKLEAEYADYTNFSETVLTDPPQASFICMDYMGNIKAVVGGIGLKAGDNIFNRATRATRQPGSCIKPITSYSYAVENKLLTWSTMFVNEPVRKIINDEGIETDWPHNYNTLSYDRMGYFTFQALQRSLNTIPAQLVTQETPLAVFDFLQNRFHISTLSASDADLAPMSVGALTNGITLKELVAAYQPFGNAGEYFEPTTYTRVLDSEGRVILQHKYVKYQALDKETAYIMNKFLQQVIEGPNGTGRAARLTQTPLIGKTGTTQDWHDLAFIGCTPDYVSGIWYGYDIPKEVTTGTYYSSSQVWKNVFGDIADSGNGKQFPDCPTVKELYYCTQTGLLAGGTCPTGDVGYYTEDNIPPYCNGVHPYLDAAAATQTN